MEDSTLKIISVYNDDEAFNKLRNNVNLNFEDSTKHGITPFLWACYKNMIKTVKLILETNSKHLADEDVEGKTCIHYAAYGNSYDVIKYLVKEKNFSLDKIDNRGTTPILIAVREKSYKVFKFLYENGANFKAEDIYHNNWEKYAYTDENRNKIKEIIVLENIIKNGNKEDLLSLISENINLIHEDIGGHPLIVTISMKSDAMNILPRIVKIMKSKGFSNEDIAKELSVQDENMDSPLHMAVKVKDDITVEFLLRNGSDQSLRNINGNTPRDLAENGKSYNVLQKFKDAMENKTESTKAVLLDAYTKDKVETIYNILKDNKKCQELIVDDEYPIIHMAARDNKPEIIQAIVDAGCDINLQLANFKDTALHIAVKNQKYEALKRLCELGADITIKNRNGKMPIDICNKNFKGINLLKGAEDSPMGFSKDKRGDSEKTIRKPKLDSSKTKETDITLSTVNAKSPRRIANAKPNESNYLAEGKKQTKEEAKGISSSSMKEVRSRFGDSAKGISSSSMRVNAKENEPTKSKVQPVINSQRAPASGRSESVKDLHRRRTRTTTTSNAHKDIRESQFKEIKTSKVIEKSPPTENYSIPAQYNIFTSTNISSEVDKATAYLIRKKMENVDDMIKRRPQICRETNLFGLTLLMTCIVFNITPTGCLIVNSKFEDKDITGRNITNLSKEFHNDNLLN